jgi:hypothetical protein
LRAVTRAKEFYGQDSILPANRVRETHMICTYVCAGRRTTFYEWDIYTKPNLYFTKLKTIN